MPRTATVEEFLANFEDRAVKILRERQTTQSFDGTLRVDPRRVYIDESEGDRILEQLRHLNLSRR